MHLYIAYCIGALHYIARPSPVFIHINENYCLEPTKSSQVLGMVLFTGSTGASTSPYL